MRHPRDRYAHRERVVRFQAREQLMHQLRESVRQIEADKAEKARQRAQMFVKRDDRGPKGS
jgi:hypothetical protein